MSPRELIPNAAVNVAPGKSNDVKTPSFSRKAWPTPALLYPPTISPRPLIPRAKVVVASGPSIEVKFPSLSRKPWVTSAKGAFSRGGEPTPPRLERGQPQCARSTDADRVPRTPTPGAALHEGR